jgi:hypothetical protein
MTRGQMVVLFAVLMLSLWTGWVVAQVRGAEPVPPACRGVDELAGLAEAAGGTLVDLIDVPGDRVDQMLIVSVGGELQWLPVWHGCVIGPPRPLMPARTKGQGV